MARQRESETKTSQKIYLEGDNCKAVDLYHGTFTGKKMWSYSKTINKIITEWRERTSLAMRGGVKP